MTLWTPSTEKKIHYAMTYTLRRYCRRHLHLHSFIRRLIFVITAIMISIVITYESQFAVYDSLHPISIHWRKVNLSLIIQPDRETAIITPQLGNNQVCGGNITQESFLDGKLLQILIMVMSAPQNLKARRAIRQTWANKIALPPEARVFFILGISPDEQVMKMVKEESTKYNDIIMEDFVDSYDNLTLKSLFTLKWASKWCTTATHLLKTDDDMLILVDNLKEKLKFIKKNHTLLQMTDLKNIPKIRVAEDGAKTNTENEDMINKQTKRGNFKKNEFGDEIFPSSELQEI